jgi:hypothetical protein
VKAIGHHEVYFEDSDRKPIKRETRQVYHDGKGTRFCRFNGVMFPLEQQGTEHYCILPMRHVFVQGRNIIGEKV